MVIFDGSLHTVLVWAFAATSHPSPTIARIPVAVEFVEFCFLFRVAMQVADVSVADCPRVGIDAGTLLESIASRDQ